MAVNEWLNHFQPTTSDIVGNIPVAGKDTPERPEAYDILLQLRRFDMKWSQGGYEDQPWILMQELNTCFQAEEEHQNIITINRQRQAEFNASFKQNIENLNRKQ